MRGLEGRHDDADVHPRPGIRPARGARERHRPGAVRTGINAGQMQGKNLRSAVSQIPYGRIGRVEDIAAAIALLACDLSDYIVGDTLLVDGGMTTPGTMPIGGRPGPAPPNPIDR